MAYAVQFHPESILTTDGFKVIDNWVKTIVEIHRCSAALRFYLSKLLAFKLTPTKYDRVVPKGTQVNFISQQCKSRTAFILNAMLLLDKSTPVRNSNSNYL